MPLYDYLCINNHRFTRFFSLKDHQPVIRCECGYTAEQRISAPLMVKVAADVRYTSPIDGTPITSHQAHQEDLKRHDCVPYDPGMKTDYINRIAQHDAALDRAIDAHVEEAIEKMPTAKRAQLHSELVEQGVTANTVRL